MRSETIEGQFMEGIRTVNRSRVNNEPHTVRRTGFNPGMEAIGERVRKAREAKKLSREQLAGAVKMPKSSLQYLEDSPTAKASRYLRAIAAELGVSLLWLETGKGEQTGNAPPQDDFSPIAASHVLRPNAAKMIEAYGAVLAYGGLHGVQINIFEPDHMEVICLAYEMLARGEQVLPHFRKSGDLEAAVRRLGQQGKADEQRDGQGRHRTRKI